MLFHNKAGQAMNLADNLTIKELLEMGVELTLSEKIDPNHELWLADEAEKKSEQGTKKGKAK
ncbi:hypothetical protein [Psychromonas antarctica]|jgi:hypothetical protein|uniref:hypothetical protein n=1 Tax=Psychromonas antarctica TaxID=67573 RepID=UPI001EE99974|nr:hypothetical protein [Psychromonas antarctica]MCG6201609.1 hypothetical protein [Psychromonas antarctica]